MKKNIEKIMEEIIMAITAGMVKELREMTAGLSEICTEKIKINQGKSRHYVGSFCFRIGDEPKPESA